ncbi:MAG: putative diguanylate cyclase DgcE [Candidatus Erwinia impunctatus]|nr:putative diguanylate cyclase DgcE [Culicoides impunctatus]
MATENTLSLNRIALWRSVLLFGIASFTLTLFCLELINISDDVSPLWFSTALMTIVTFRYSVEILPLLLSSCLLGVISADALVMGFSLPWLLFPFINLFQALLGGLFLRLLLSSSAPLHSLSSWFRMVLSVCLFTPLIGGIVSCWLVSFTHSVTQPHHFFTTWVTSEAIGMLGLGPVGLLWHHSLFHRMNFRRWGETFLTLIITLGLVYLVLNYLPWPFVFIIVLLFYSAVRLPRFDAFLVVFTTLVLMMVMLALHLLTPQPYNYWLDESFDILPFMMAVFPVHVMILIMHSLKEEKRFISESETRFRHAMEYSAIGMALLSPKGHWLQVNASLSELLVYSKNEFIDIPFRQMAHSDDHLRDRKIVASMLNTNRQNYTVDKRFVHKDGHIVWTVFSLILVRNADNQPLYFIAQIKDISGLRASQQTNHQLMQGMTLANEAGGIGVWEWDFKLQKMTWDSRMMELYGLRADEEVNHLKWLKSIVPADRQRVIEKYQQGVKAKSPVDIQFRIINGQEIIYIRSQSQIFLDGKGKPDKILVINQDITPLHRLTEALHREKDRMTITLDAIGEAVISTDEKMRIIFMNPVAERMTGWTQDLASGLPVRDILCITEGHDGKQADRSLLTYVQQVKVSPNIDAELILHSHNGQQFDIHYSITPLTTNEGEVIGSVLVIHDVSASREIMRKLSYNASHDMLTQLPNRVLFEQRLNEKIASAVAENQQHALVYLDLDLFKAVNDTAGHAAGDALLQSLALLMKKYLRRKDSIARLGGDELGILLANTNKNQAEQIIHRGIRAICRYRFQWQGHYYRIGVSAGLTYITADNHQLDEVMSQADFTCYQAKYTGRGKLVVFDTTQQQGLRDWHARFATATAQADSGN